MCSPLSFVYDIGLYYLHLQNYNNYYVVCLHVYNITCINMYKYTYITIKIIIYIIHIYYFRRYVTLGRPPDPRLSQSVTPWPTPITPRALRNSWNGPLYPWLSLHGTCSQCSGINLLLFKFSFIFFSNSSLTYCPQCWHSTRIWCSFIFARKIALVNVALGVGVLYSSMVGKR